MQFVRRQYPPTVEVVVPVHRKQPLMFDGDDETEARRMEMGEHRMGREPLLVMTRRQENRLLSCQESSCSGQGGEVLRQCTWDKCRRHIPGFKRRQMHTAMMADHSSQSEHLNHQPKMELEPEVEAERQPLQRHTRAWIDYTSDCQRLACSAVRRGNHVIRLCEQLACEDYF